MAAHASGSTGACPADDGRLRRARFSRSDQAAGPPAIGPGAAGPGVAGERGTASRAAGRGAAGSRTGRGAVGSRTGRGGVGSRTGRGGVGPEASGRSAADRCAAVSIARRWAPARRCDDCRHSANDVPPWKTAAGFHPASSSGHPGGRSTAGGPVGSITRQPRDPPGGSRRRHPATSRSRTRIRRPFMRNPGRLTSPASARSQPSGCLLTHRPRRLPPGTRRSLRFLALGRRSAHWMPRPAPGPGRRRCRRPRCLTRPRGSASSLAQCRVRSSGQRLAFRRPAG